MERIKEFDDALNNRNVTYRNDMMIEIVLKSIGLLIIIALLLRLTGVI